MVLVDSVRVRGLAGADVGVIDRARNSLLVPWLLSRPTPKYRPTPSCNHFGVHLSGLIERAFRAWCPTESGGDWGAFVVDQMGLQAPRGLLAIHTNMPAVVPNDINTALSRGDPPPPGLSAEEQRASEQLARTFKQVQYAVLMAARPQQRPLRRAEPDHEHHR
jgi:hypothetical protein